MKNFFSFFTKNRSILFKIFLFIITTILIIYLLPKGGQFKYNFQKGKLWQYENLYAPFSFSIKKSQEVIELEKEEILNNSIPYFDYDSSIYDLVRIQFEGLVESTFDKNKFYDSKSKVKETGNLILEKLYQRGILDEFHSYSDKRIVYLKNGNEIEEVYFDQFIQTDRIDTILVSEISKIKFQNAENYLKETLSSVIIPNVSLNIKLTEAEIDLKINAISPNWGVVEKGGRIIAKGEVVEGVKFQMLQSLKEEYQSQVWSQSNYTWIIVGYSVLISLVFLMLFLFLMKYRPVIYENNTKLTFIFFNILLMIFITTLVIDYDAELVYITPLCILPLVLKTFFDARLGLFVHVLTLLLLGFVVPNSFEFVFLQIIAGIVTILTISELYKRANLFISVGQITLVYIIGYFAFFIIQEGNIELIEWRYFAYFVLCGLITLFAFPLIYIYEKIFGLVSDVSLLELSDTNSTLLKELENKAPGTFHHSLNVANLSEAAANEIGANSMLVRVGALYHDIGKMVNPTYFTENQVNSINSHDELEPKESARIIIDHVIKGIEIARKHNLPDRIIDFIRTHHGTNLVYYFYKKEVENQGDANKKDFTYPGPIPFSKETAILMMADSVEAASKSLKNPTSSKIDGFVENIINGQMEHGQFLNANITFQEIQTIKKVLKKKLNNIYHLRVEYPE